MRRIELYGQFQQISGTTPPAGFTPYYQSIDLSDADPIVISDSIFDLEDPTVIPSSFSETYTVPATPNNAKFFSQAFEINAFGFNPTKKVLCYINVDGTFFLDGYFTLQKIILDNKGQNAEFEILFVGQVRTFGAAIEGKYVAELDLTDWNHLLTWININNSWNAGTTGTKLLNGDVLYPLCEWGYDYNDDINQPIDTTLSVYGGTASVKGFTNSANPLLLTQWRPFVKAKVIWDRIFAEAGFTYSSSFLSSDPRFLDLYLHTTANATSQIFRGTPFTNSFGTPEFVGALGSWWKLKYNFTPVEQDFYNAYDPVYGEYTLPANVPSLSGALTLRYEYGTISGGTNPTLTVRLRRIRAGAITTVFTQTISGIPSTTPQRTETIGYATGAQLEGDAFYWEANFSAGWFSYVRLSGNRWTLIFPWVMNLSSMFPPDEFTQAEFIRMLTNKFHLIWERDPNQPKNFLIEPWPTWILQGREYSWTDVINEERPVEFTPLFLEGNQILQFSDAGEADLNNDLYEKQYKRVFGQLTLDTGIEVLEGEQNITTTCAPVPLSPIGLSNSFLIPHFAVDSETRREPMKVLPRLMYYNGIQDAVDSVGNAQTWYMQNDISASIPYTTYPLVSQFFSWPPDLDTFDLNFANSRQFWDPAYNQGIVGFSQVNAYTEFWDLWYQNFYNPYSKLMTATFRLDSLDIQQLRFNDRIWIKNAWWFPVSYSNFEIGKTQNVEVTLVKYGGELNLSVGGASGLNQQTGLCYGLSECAACCCETGISSAILWTNGGTLATSTFAYSSPSGALPSAGWYKQGSYSYYVTSNGLISSPYLCSACACGQVIPEFLTEYVGCSGPTPCDAFCCGSTASIWIDGGITGATELFRNEAGEGLVPYNWYAIPGTDWVYQVGANGSTIIQGGTGGDCECPVNDYELFLSEGTGIFETASLGACCLAGMTGASGPRTIYTDDPDFLTATSFSYDPFGNFPVGVPSEIVLSDGENYIGVSGGAPTSSGACTVNICADRTVGIKCRLINESSDPADIVAQMEISLDDTNFFWANQDAQTGGPFDYNFDTDYSPASYWRTTILSGVDSAYTIEVYQNTNLIETIIIDVLNAGDSYNTTSYLVSTDTWQIDIYSYPIV